MIMKRMQTISVSEITITYDSQNPRDFMNKVFEEIQRMEGKGSIAEVHYSTAMYGSSFIYSAIILEKQEV